MRSKAREVYINKQETFTFIDDELIVRVTHGAYDDLLGRFFHGDDWFPLGVLKLTLEPGSRMNVNTCYGFLKNACIEVTLPMATARIMYDWMRLYQRYNGWPY